MLNEKAMLINLSISQWCARKYDKKITKETNDLHNADNNAGRYNKQLIAKENLENIQKIVNQARVFHYENTLPWMDEGARILPASNFFEYTTKIKSFKDKFEVVVAKFLDNYESFVEESKIKLNSMFNASDYPEKNHVINLFSFNTDIMPLPDSNDFRVQLSDYETAIIKQSIEEKSKIAIENANKDLWNRLYTAINHIKEKLSIKDSIFRDSLIENLKDLCKLLPKLNITGDVKLEQLAKDALNNLAIDPETLRNNKDIRDDTAQNASVILEKMKGYIG